MDDITPDPPDDATQDGTIQPDEPEPAEQVQAEPDIEDRPEDAIQDQTDPGAFELPALADFGINSNGQSDIDLPGFDASDEVDERLSAIEDTLEQIPQPPFFPGVAIFQQGTGNSYSELVPLNNTLSLAGTGSFIYDGATSGSTAISLASDQFVAVLMPDNGTSTSNIAVIKISGGGSTSSGNISLTYLTQVGGSDGNGTSPATWTYNLYSDAAKTILLSSSQSMMTPRVTAASNTPATAGIYTVISGASKLLYAFESYVLDTCASDAGFSFR